MLWKYCSLLLANNFRGLLLPNGPWGQQPKPRSTYDSARFSFSLGQATHTSGIKRHIMGGHVNIVVQWHQACFDFMIPVICPQVDFFEHLDVFFGYAINILEDARQNFSPVPTNSLDKLISKPVFAVTAIHVINCFKHIGTHRPGDHLGLCLRNKYNWPTIDKDMITTDLVYEFLHI